MKAFLEEHGLRLRDPSAAVLPPALRGQVLVLVQESLGICRDLLRVGKRAELPALPSWCAVRGRALPGWSLLSDGGTGCVASSAECPSFLSINLPLHQRLRGGVERIRCAAARLRLRTVDQHLPCARSTVLLGQHAAAPSPPRSRRPARRGGGRDRAAAAAGRGGDGQQRRAARQHAAPEVAARHPGAPPRTCWASHALLSQLCASRLLLLAVGQRMLDLLKCQNILAAARPVPPPPPCTTPAGAAPDQRAEAAAAAAAQRAPRPHAAHLPAAAAAQHAGGPPGRQPCPAPSTPEIRHQSLSVCVHPRPHPQAMSLMLLPDGGVAGSTPASTADSRAASGAQAAKLAGVLRLVKVRVPAEHVPPAGVAASLRWVAATAAHRPGLHPLHRRPRLPSPALPVLLPGA